MAAPVRTALTTGSNKTSNATINSASITLATGDMLVVLFSGDTAVTSVTWNSNNLISGVSYTLPDVYSSLWYYKVTSGASAVVTMNYNSAIAKAWAISKITNVNRLSASNKSAGSSGTPNSATVTSTIVDSALIGAVGTEGPSEDTAGTWGNSFSAGQRSGTTGNPAAGNMTIAEGYRILTSTTTTEISNTGMTSRDWSAILAVFDNYWAGYAQANAGIKTTYNGYAQSQVDIKQTIFWGHAQAQALLNQRWQYAQAAVLIDSLYKVGHDTFTRTSSTSLGTSDDAGNWVNYINNPPWTTDGSKAVYSSSTTTSSSYYYSNLYKLGSRNWEFSIELTPQTITDIVKFNFLGNRPGWIALLVGTDGSGNLGIGSQVIFNSTGSLGLNGIKDGGGLGAVSGLTWTAATTYRLKIRVVYDPTIKLNIKIWDIGGSEPDWQTSLTPTGDFPLGHFGIGFSQTAGSEIVHIDNLVYNAIYITPQVAQAQAQIIPSMTAGFAQTQAQIKQTYPLGQTYRETILSDSPTGYWRLGESSGTIQDETAGNRDGTVYGTVNYGQNSLISSDATNKSVSFTPQGGITISGSSWWTGTNMSLEIWADLEDNPTVYRFMSGIRADVNGNNQFYILHKQYSHDIEARFRNSSGTTFDITGTNVAAGIHYFALVKEGINLTLYIDGQYATSRSDLTGSLNDDNTRIGLIGDAISYNYINRLDEAAVYNVALTPAQISKHYSAGLYGIRSATFAQAQTVLRAYSLYDTFTRTNASGWGESDNAGPWSSSDSSKLSTDGSNGIYTTTSSNTTWAGIITLRGPSSRKFMTRFKFKVSSLTNQNEINIWDGLTSYAIDGFGAGAWTNADGSVTIMHYQDGTGGGMPIAPAGFIIADTWYEMHLWINMPQNDTVYGRIWKSSDPSTVYSNSAWNSAGITPASLGYVGWRLKADNSSITIDDLIFDEIYFEGVAQAQTTITAGPVAYRGYGQSQAQLKSFAVKSYAQSQAHIKVTGNNIYAQSLAGIKQAYQAWAQGNAHIKRSEQVYAQGNTWVKVTGINSYAQTQTQVKQTYRVYAQAQASILSAANNIFSQAQTSVIVHNNNGWAQSQTRIFRRTFYDDFNRVVADGLGTSTSGHEYIKRWYSSNNVLTSVNGSYARIIREDTSGNPLVAYSFEPGQIYEGIIQFDFRFPDNLGVLNQARFIIITVASDEANIENVDTPIQMQIYLTKSLLNPTIISSFSYNTWYTVKFYVSDTSGATVRQKAWARDTESEPNWQRSGTASPYAFSDYVLAIFPPMWDGVDLGYIELDNIQILNAGASWYRAGGQSKTSIQQTYQVYAQAQVQIATGATQVYAQSQAWIINTQLTVAQAQTQIITGGYQHSQATVYIYIPQIARPIADISNNGWVRVVI